MNYTLTAALGNLGMLAIVIWSSVDCRRQRRTSRVLGAVLRQLIAADERCGTPGCQVTNLGHLLDQLSPSAVEVVKAHDPLYVPEQRS